MYRGQYCRTLQRKARRRGVLKGYRLWVIGYRMGLFGTIVRNGGDAAPERPNIKEKTAIGYDLPLLENIFSKEGC